jgi:hypothetical protein
MIMLTGTDYISELRPPTGLLFISQVKNVHTSKGSLTCCNILNGADGFTSPPKEGVLRIFIALKNPSPSTGFERVNLGSNDKHANNYTPGTTM